MSSNLEPGRWVGDRSRSRAKGYAPHLKLRKFGGRSGPSLEVGDEGTAGVKMSQKLKPKKLDG